MMLRTAILLLGLSLGACRLGDASVAVRLPSVGNGSDALDVVVIDRAGVVVGVAGAPDWVDEGVTLGDRPDLVVVGWMGGMCDVRTTLTVTADSGTLTIEEATTTSGGGCRLAGISRGVVLDLDREVAPETLRFIRAPAP